ncbi:serine hydrolase [Roseiconus lacunae]|uniref:serine hydrolase n=1 Tax=Roseiconus lacunae TaxID=2605694 RepID=UPI0013570A37|nr:serine hydrolase [Roseiconus lacunae]
MRSLSFLIFILTTCSLSAQSEFLHGNADRIEAFLQQHFNDSKYGMVIGLVDEHGTRFFSSGSLDNGTEKLVNEHTIFEMGSVTKVFTSLLLLDAIQRGEVNLDDPVEDYLPEGVAVPTYRGIKITLLNLAVQDSGLPWNTPQQAALLKPESGQPDLKAFKESAASFTVENLYEFLSTYELQQEPGARFQYSNIGMALLGHAIERATGIDYEKLVIDRICRPLGMTDTRFTLSAEQKVRLAYGHMVDETKAEFWKLQAMQPAGGLLTTADDLMKLLSANLGLSKTPLTPLMKQTHVIHHDESTQFGRTAMPWFDNGVYNPPGSNLLGHAGGGAGTVAFTAFDTANRRGVVVLTNQMKVYPNPVGWTLIQEMPFTRSNTSYAVRQVVGVGIGFRKDKLTGELRIIRVYPQSPAGKAGLSVDAIVTRIDDTSVEKIDLLECMRLMSGDADTPVRLRMRDDEGIEKNVKLIRRPFLTRS